jgi:CubicO group peptidase (beta-lactamase class C family)
MRFLLRLIVLLASIDSAFPADPSPQKVDEIFKPYASAHSPGCSVGVIRDGDFVFRKSYGEASLELAVPLTTESVFYLASVSKQFTAASVVLAGNQGFLALDDDVHKYVPELPDYGHPITLRQMMHQSSGLRDFLALTYLSGRDIASLSSPDEVQKMIVRQNGLNNVPGDEFVYSNSNYFLLGVVLKRATGKSLAEFADENIFRPLGMAQTLFYDDRMVVVPNRVAAYDSIGQGKFHVDWSTVFDIVGSGGLMSNVGDLLLWDRNFYSGKIGNGMLRRELETPGILNNGKNVNYGLGLWLSEYRGLRTVEHSGGTFGYRTELLRFPSQRFSVVALCNVANADVEGFARRIADIYLEKQLKPEASGTTKSGAFPDPEPFAGTYLDPRTHMTYTFTAVNENLMAWGARLKRSGVNEFSDLVGNPIVFRNSNGTMNATLTLQGETYFSGLRVPDIHMSASALTAFAGDYHSQELDATYRLSLVEGSLMLNNGDRSPVKLIPVATNQFQAGDLGTVVFRPGRNKQVSAITLFSQAARGILFEKRN